MAKLTPISVRLEPEQKQALERAALKARRAPADLTRIVLSDWLLQHGFLVSPENEAA
jgi:uncharacterized protein (DUF1778 family)